MPSFTNALMACRQVARSNGWIGAAAVAAVLLFSDDASAADYSVTYAIDANGKTDAGKVESCKYSESCEIRSAALGMQIFLAFLHPDHRSAEVEIYGPNGCCYSADAGSTFYVGIKPGLLRVPIYAGKRRKGNEFVLNQRYGVLYIEFSGMQ